MFYCNENVKLCKRLPKKYWDRVDCIVPEPDLIDGCKFMLYLHDGYSWGGDYNSIPVRSITEAIAFIKDSDHIKVGAINENKDN